MFSSLTETFMAPAGFKDAAAAGKSAGKLAGKRPSPLRPTRSASRVESMADSSPTAQKRPSVVISGTGVGGRSLSTQEVPPETEKGVVPEPETTPEPPRGSIDLDGLPIELIGLTDRYVDQ